MSVSDKQDDEKLCNVIKHMAKMQTQLTAFNSGQQRMGAMLPEFKQDIIRAVGGTISEEFSQLLNQFASSTESIENYFSQLKNQIEESKEEVIKAIRDESAKSEKLITDLKNEVSAKDQQLNQQFEDLTELKNQASCHSHLESAENLKAKCKQLEDKITELNQQNEALRSQLAQN